jgi:hypothetical protein
MREKKTKSCCTGALICDGLRTCCRAWLHDLSDERSTAAFVLRVAEGACAWNGGERGCRCVDVETFVVDR